MKNVMVVDGAENCAYDCFAVSEEFFLKLFPSPGQDIEFIEDVLARDPDNLLEAEFNLMLNNAVSKKDIEGLHGILFYELEFKKPYYPNKRDSDLDGVGRAAKLVEP